MNPAAFMTALQLADSAFPTGMYAHSHGLEGMITRGWVRTAAEVEEFLSSQCVWALLPADGVALLHAHRCTTIGEAATIAAIDRRLHAMRLPAELRAASTQVGRRLLTETAHFADHPTLAAYHALVRQGQTPGGAAVAFGVACAALEVHETIALLASVHSYLNSELGAALRLMPLSHRDTQAMLRRLQGVVAGELPALRTRDWREMTSFTPQLDIAAMLHETDDLRMFAS
jgi:urease accessory protein